MKEFVISEAKTETAVLVGLITKDQDEAKTKEYLDELEFLADTAGAVTVKRFTQRLNGPSSVTYVGQGKLDEIRQYIKDEEEKAKFIGGKVNSVIVFNPNKAFEGAEVEIAYDPMNTDSIKVLYRDMEPVIAHRVRIDAFCDKVPHVPVGMTEMVPETSRFLDALEKKYKEDHHLMANAISFGEYGRAGGSHV